MADTPKPRRVPLGEPLTADELARCVGTGDTAAEAMEAQELWEQRAPTYAKKGEEEMSQTLRNQLQRAMDDIADAPQETPYSSFPAMLEAHTADLRQAWYAMGRPWPVTMGEVMEMTEQMKATETPLVTDGERVFSWQNGFGEAVSQLRNGPSVRWHIHADGEPNNTSYVKGEIINMTNLDGTVRRVRVVDVVPTGMYGGFTLKLEEVDE